MSDLGEFEEQQRKRRVRAGSPADYDFDGPPIQLIERKTWRDFLPRICMAALLVLIFWSLAAIMAMFPMVKP